MNLGTPPRLQLDTRNRAPFSNSDGVVPNSSSQMGLTVGSAREGTEPTSRAIVVASVVSARPSGHADARTPDCRFLLMASLASNRRSWWEAASEMSRKPHVLGSAPDNEYVAGILTDELKL